MCRQRLCYIFLRRVDDALRTLLQCGFELMDIVTQCGPRCQGCASYQWHYLGWLIVQSACKPFVVCNQMRNVYIAEVLFYEDVFADLVSERSSICQRLEVVRSYFD